MTPTEQDKELREALTNMQIEFLKKCGMDNLIPHIIDTDDNAGQAMRDDLMQLITADRKRVELEARVDELDRQPEFSWTLKRIADLTNQLNQLKGEK